MSTQTVIGRHG